MSEENPTNGKVVKRACTECRQQKAKCDAYLEPDKPCSRCRKMHRECMISEPFKREHKRKRLSELEQQTDELQERLRASSHPESAILPGSSWAAVNDLPAANTDTDSRLASVAPFFTQDAIAPVSFRSFSRTAGECLQTPESLPHDFQPSGASPRTIDGHTVDSKDIDALFQLYFRDYAGLLPILDPSITPDGYYKLSPFLFWAVIGASCRTYSKNPTLLSVLPLKIQTMALMSLNSHQVTLAIVQGMLLLLHWPFPKSNNGHDLTYPLSAAVLHMAMQIGLHLPVASQEFSKNRVRLTEEDLRIRAETWGYCTLIYQRFCWYKGNPATPMLDVPHDLEQRRELFQRISPKLKFELKLQDVVTRCCIAVAQNGLRNMTAEHERSLDTLLNVFLAQITSVGLECASELHHLYVQVATLVVQAFNLWKSPAAQDPTALYDLCVSCCRAIESFEALDKSGHICLSASGIYFIYSMMVPSHILLRLLKTSFSRYINVERARSALFLGISLHKKMSVQNDDVPARNGMALTQLWNSAHVFKRQNGTEAVALRIRSRLTGSIVLDGVVWWREEFGGLMGVYPPPLCDNRNEEAPRSDSAGGSNETAMTESAMPSVIRPDYSTFMDDPMLTEFGWPVSDDIFSSIWTDGQVPAI
ncbi:hypothetical protein G647_01486 [Cladophialophora carrionii CBS 160.54]|uniref:Zn(2)-C6 fungal-type domain-containing protein n=1 Tax=Cladophialophora carrionii CBS 160.54 TaxID=1279043 RepID=V9DRU7_9EURO|nr:uncharacterized protein G647_01486 [Cladophialophora carrionii CBS 160.54]ETI29033.1 hypothetical protein G647_01486 [Cladophialophora carrionii CBS 160.54]